jgi:cyclohexadieny/prephenate dehydrogenase
MTELLYDKVAIIGIGLIGSSVLHAASRAQLAGELLAWDHKAEVREEARQLGLPARIVEDIPELGAADLVLLCVPVGAMAGVMQTLGPCLRPDTVITDTGSTKRSVIRDVGPLVPDHSIFIPSHPLAGTEFSGPGAGFPDLFKNRYWLLINNGAPAEQMDRLASFFTGLGAVSEVMDADYHDRILAITSHLPHLIAYTIVSTAVDLETDLKNDVIRFSASGFRDFTRIAASDPTMWRDVFLNNDEAVLEMLQRFSEDLSYLQRAIRWQEGDKLHDLFTRTRSIRRSIIDAGQD